MWAVCLHHINYKKHYNNKLMMAFTYTKTFIYLFLKNLWWNLQMLL